MDKMLLVKVLWLDSYSSYAGWDNEEDTKRHTVAHCESVGYLLRQDDTEIVLIQSFCADNNTFNGQINIPAKAVVKIQELKAE